MPDGNFVARASITTTEVSQNALVVLVDAPAAAIAASGSEAKKPEPVRVRALPMSCNIRIVSDDCSYPSQPIAGSGAGGFRVGGPQGRKAARPRSH